MLSGLNTTGHEIGGSLGHRGPRDHRRRDPGHAHGAAASPHRRRHRQRVPRRRHHRRRRERRALAILPSAKSFLPRARARPAGRPSTDPRWRPLQTSPPPPGVARTPSAASPHPRRRHRRAGERPRRQHGRDRSPRGRRARHDLRPLPHPRSADRRHHRPRDRRGHRRASRLRTPARANPQTRSPACLERRAGRTSGATTRSSRSTPASPPRTFTPSISPCYAWCATRQTRPSQRRLQPSPTDWLDADGPARTHPRRQPRRHRRNAPRRQSRTRTDHHRHRRVLPTGAR